MNELVIGSGRGGRKPTGELQVEIVRELCEGDLPALANPPPVESRAPSVQSLRASHHQLAQVLAQGTSEGEAALITGYSLSRISVLKTDPTFSELLAHYQHNRELVFADVLERMKVLGLSSLDELQERLEQEPGAWSRRELMELAELMLIKGRMQGGAVAGAGGGAGVSVTVSFVSAPERPELVIEGESSNGRD